MPVCVSALIVGLLAGATADVAKAAPFAVQGPGVRPADFRVTAFATNLSYPLGMARLEDGSLLVAVSDGANFSTAVGKLLRFVDADNDGVADAAGTVLYTGLPSGQTACRRGGKLIFVTGQGTSKPITVLRTGATPGAAFSLVGHINLNYASSWYHPHSALFVRDTPGATNTHDLFFQLGSQNNYDPTTGSGSISSSNIAGVAGTILGDSIYRLTIVDEGTSVRATNLTRIASGLRNATGFLFHPRTGDFYFQDNGIDGLPPADGNEPLSADELNVIPVASYGGAVEYFGFPTNYIEYRTGRNIGGLGVQPIVAFQPIPSPNGSESEGPNDIVFAPPGFPEGLNDGIFVGFHGKFFGAGLANEENPVVFVDLRTTNYFHFIGNDEPNIGHLDGLLATEDSLFAADLTSNGRLDTGGGRGVIYQIKSLVLPPVRLRWVGQRVELTWKYGKLQGADNVTGSWNDIAGATSPYVVDVDQAGRFFRTRN